MGDSPTPSVRQAHRELEISVAEVCDTQRGDEWNCNRRKVKTSNILVSIIVFDCNTALVLVYSLHLRMIPSTVCLLV